ncbi:N-acetyltransferase [Paenibacillus baekrokdamisoli]|uniref:N-acetyltransferase n=1 Tax=Paenibacillus baekrokdamisoli TaxID=1712516 RepID=A0A3G9IWG1_9BACL|nr:GNAT family N-acetyltransferase [Paenibacillus baekrokdamisoli]MBB3068100.1 ribosomal protein S18 acetylase RimI-like enzyme [Paenibacillus baekrokdamisoli]BBH22856.1 N-acetyltransferase [Paenibacillus baekrokdamisoli]
MIRTATKEDAAQVMPLMLDAIGSIALLLAGTLDEKEAMIRLEAFYMQSGNRISYENVLVEEREGQVVGMLIAYPGDGAEKLDEPFLTSIQNEKGASEETIIVTEARPGEYYYDAIAVNEAFRGQGIAQLLMQSGEEIAAAAGYSKVGLIVEAYNEGAYALYKKKGFEEDGELQIGDNSYRRMVKPIK